MEIFEKSAVSSIKVLDIYSKKHKPQLVMGRGYHSLSYRYTGKIKVMLPGSEVYSLPSASIFILPV